jgi:prolyl oligopeptidase
MKNIAVYLLSPLLIFLVVGCQSKSNVNPPQTRKDTITTNYFGTTVSDPYRWLEDGSSAEVKDWINEQNSYSDRILSGFSEAGPLTKRINTLAVTSVERYSPTIVNGKLFFRQFTPPQAQPVIAYKTWPDGKINVLIDPNKGKNNMAITAFWPSPMGNFIAYGTAVGGNEATTIHIINVKTGRDLEETLPNAGGGATPIGLVWDANEKGFTYVRLPEPGTVPQSELQFYASLYHHFLGHPVKDDKLVFGKDLSKVAEYTFIPSANAEHAAMFVHFGDGNPDFVYLRQGIDTWKQVIDTSANIRVASEVNAGADWDSDNLLVIAYQDAPKGKLISIAPDGKSKVLIPEGDWAMNSVTTVKGGILITKVLGPDWEVDQYTTDGKFVRTVPLPKTGIEVRKIAASDASDQALITYSGWTIPESWAQYNMKSGNLQTVFETKAAADYSKIHTAAINAVSKDGTKIPVTVIAMEGINPNGKRPTIVYGYGGYGICTAPFFMGPYLAWLENGGVMAFANIRGGGEFGEGWHEAGMLGKKQNVFDDMFAAAEAIVKNNWTDKDHLGILGGSNGGLLMGAEITQHPGAFKAVVSRVGIYDMLRAELFPNGQYNISEYGTSTKEPDFKWLYAYSPYHNVKPDTKYPAILLQTAVNDPRVATWQSRKFAAALRAANTSDNPVLLITRMNEGHGVTASFSQRVNNTAAALTFFAHELGLKVNK